MTGLNDGRWPDAKAVMVRYPLAESQVTGDIFDPEVQAQLRTERETWPWLPGEIAGQCGPDEWECVIYDRRVARLEDGSPAPDGTPDEDLYFPLCFRDGAEIREPERAAEPQMEAGQ